MSPDPVSSSTGVDLQNNSEKRKERVCERWNVETKDRLDSAGLGS